MKRVQNNSNKSTQKSVEKIRIVNELHRSARKNYRRRRVIVKGLYDLYQADLAEMIPYADENSGHKYILTVIDAFSKFAWALPLKSKRGKDVADAMLKILKKLKKSPKNLQTDNGTEFYNVNFQNLMKKYSINHYSSFSNLKSSIVERFIRTLKTRLWRHFSIEGNYRWLKALPTIVDDYNDTRHRTIGMKPREVNVKNAKRLLETVYSHPKTLDVRKQKIYVGDSVRISKYKHLFAKGYLPNWTTEIFTVSKVKLNTNPRTYELTDANNVPIKGGFYEEELQKVPDHNVYLVEKVLKTRGNRLYVKWLGFDDTHNSWILKKDVV